MKTSLFFISGDYNLARILATKVAEFFDMRIFDSIEMFEFDHSPRKIDDVISEFGNDYVKKKMKSIFKMQLEFSDSVLIADLKYIDQTKSFFNEIKSKNLIVFINSNNLLTSCEKFNKIELLADGCDIAINSKDFAEEEIFSEIIFQIKKYFHIEA